MKRLGKKLCVLLIIFLLIELAIVNKHYNFERPQNEPSFPTNWAYGCNITPSFLYNDMLYYYTGENISKFPNQDSVRIISKGLTANPDNSQLQNFQTNYAELFGYEVWKNSGDDKKNPERLYIFDGTTYQIFVPDFCRGHWIYIDGALFLSESQYATYCNSATCETRNSSILADGFEPIGYAHFDEVYKLPSEQLFTNDISINGKEVYYNAGSPDSVYVAIPKGLFVEGKYYIRYDKYYKTNISIYEHRGTVLTEG